MHEDDLAEGSAGIACVTQVDVRQNCCSHDANYEWLENFFVRNLSHKRHYFQSSSVFKSKTGFVKKDDKWIEAETGDFFDATSRSFGANVSRLRGFDTFWYNWSLNNPETELLNSIK